MTVRTLRSWDGPQGHNFDLPLDSLDILQIKIDYAITFVFEDGSDLRIEEAVKFREPGQAELYISPNTQQSLWGPVLMTVNTSLVAATASERGKLSLTFEGGRELIVEPSERYEAWSFNRATGQLLISMPGGSLAYFPGTAGRTE